MSVPVGQMLAVLRHVAVQRLRGNARYPLVLMLEPLFRCNLACGGCGKIQHPAEILRSHLTPEQCFAAVDECGAPMVSIPGGEPLKTRRQLRGIRVHGRLHGGADPPVFRGDDDGTRFFCPWRSSFTSLTLDGGFFAAEMAFRKSSGCGAWTNV